MNVSPTIYNCRYVESSPSWAKQLEGEMKLGKHELTFTANSPFSNQSASCIMKVHIKDMDPPKVVSCPSSFIVYLEEGQTKSSVNWIEPVFKDNVGIQHVMASFLPGQEFEAGRHHVLYQAADGDRNRARCGFTITVKAQEISPPHRRIPPRFHTSQNGHHVPATPTQRPVNKHPVYRPPVPTTHRPPGLTPRPNSLPSPIVSFRNNMPSVCNQVPDVPNGKMACVDRRSSKKCTPVCNLNHVFYQKFSYKPPTYLCSARRVDWQINRFIPDCSPSQRARNGWCPEGMEFRDNECIGCPPGMYRTTSQQLCQLCPKGSYADGFSSKECKKCGPGQYTTGLGRIF